MEQENIELCPKLPEDRGFSILSSKIMALDLFSNKAVKGCSYPHLKIRFDALFSHHGKTRRNLEEYLGFSRAYVCDVVNGKLIPPPSIRIKIAKFFSTDTLAIWSASEDSIEKLKGGNQIKESYSI